MKIKNFGTEDVPLMLATATISVDGKNEEIIPALREGSRVFNPSAKDVSVFGELDSGGLLDSIFNFTPSEPFFEAGCTLTDLRGAPIPNPMPEGSAKVLVYLDDAVSFWQWGKREVIPAVVHDFATAKEALIAIGATDFFSRPLNNVEAVGLAASVSGDPVYGAVWRFANANKVSMNTAALYLDAQGVKSRVSRVVSMGLPVEVIPKQGRSYEDATLLFRAIAKATHSVKVASNRYLISVINGLITFSMEEILSVLEALSYDEGESLRLAGCNDKEMCFRDVLRPHLKALYLQKSTNEAA